MVGQNMRPPLDGSSVVWILLPVVVRPLHSKMMRYRATHSATAAIKFFVGTQTILPMIRAMDIPVCRRLVSSLPTDIIQPLEIQLMPKLLATVRTARHASPMRLDQRTLHSFTARRTSWQYPQRRLQGGIMNKSVAIAASGWLVSIGAVTAQAQEEIQRLRDDMTAQIQGLSGQVQVAAPRDSVLAFDLPSCPNGWSKYAPAIGRFVRGVDPSTGGRQTSTFEDDALQGHTFGDGGDKILRWNPSHTTDDPGNGYSGMQTTGVFAPNGFNPAFGNTADAKIVGDGTHGTPRVADETRPKNVALLYCKKE